jgi:hypothetical protein
MPHIKLSRPDNLNDIWKDPPQFSYTVQNKDISFKYGNSYLSKDETELLLKYAVVEGRLIQHVFLSLRLEDEYMIIRLAKNYPVLRTEGTKLLMAVITAFFEERGLSFLASSIEPYLKDGRFYQKHME